MLLKNGSKNMKEAKHILPKWIRFRDDAQAKIHQEYLDAYRNPSENWKWFSQLVDYQECCNRTSRFQTTKTRAIRFLIYLAEKIARL